MGLRELFAPAAVWGRDPSFFSVRIEDPVSEGFIRVSSSVPPEVMTIRPLLGRDHLRIDSLRRANSVGCDLARGSGGRTSYPVGLHAACRP